MTWRGHPYQGLFITFEGVDGSGKSTAIREFDKWLRHCDYAVTTTREPGGTKAGEYLRGALLDPDVGNMDSFTELLVFLASRSQLVTEVIQPALKRGEIVLSDRYIDATVAYQGTAGGVPLDFIHYGNRIATHGIYPDMTYVIDASRETIARRLGCVRLFSDRFESRQEEFHDRVRSGFHGIAKLEPQRVSVINSDSLSEEGVQVIVRDRFQRYVDDNELESVLAKA